VAKWLSVFGAMQTAQQRKQSNPDHNPIPHPKPNPINDYFRGCAICVAPNTDSPDGERLLALVSV